jgi:hypothetical protein
MPNDDIGTTATPTSSGHDTRGMGPTMECPNGCVLIAILCLSFSNFGCAELMCISSKQCAKDILPPFSSAYVKQQHVGIGPSWTTGIRSKDGSLIKVETSTTPGLYVQYERRLSEHLYLNVPFERIAAARVRSDSVDVPRSYSSLFITPGLQLRGPADWWVSWFVTGGAGFGRFVMRRELLSGASNMARLTSQSAVGYVNIGVDVTIRPHWSIRADIRGHYAKPRFLSDPLKTYGYPASLSVMPIFRF